MYEGLYLCKFPGGEVIGVQQPLGAVPVADGQGHLAPAVAVADVCCLVPHLGGG